jgi:hypothetical protein
MVVEVDAGGSENQLPHPTAVGYRAWSPAVEDSTGESLNPRRSGSYFIANGVMVNNQGFTQI